MSKKAINVILAVGAHPDDIEFGCGATLARLVTEGAQAYIIVCTDGHRGSRQHRFDKKELVNNRKQEQTKAAKILGVKEVFFLDHEDGNLIADISLKEQLVRLIRQLKPDIIITHDPSWHYKIDKDRAFINHTDHRATGMAVLDAVYPLSRDILSFPEHSADGLSPHHVPEVWLFSFGETDHLVDATDYFDTKLKSIQSHKSQIDDIAEVRKWMEQYMSKLGQKSNCRYAEGFIRLLLD